MKRLLLLSSLALLPCCGEKEKKESATPAPATPAAGSPSSPAATASAPASAGALETKDGMVHLPGGAYTMGHEGVFHTAYGDKEFPEEGPEHKVTVKAFWIDETEVTNTQFAAFVKATNYVTFAERRVKVEDFPAEARASLPAGELFNGAIIFREDAHGNLQEVDDLGARWRWDPKANWRHPAGEGSTITGKENYPVVCVTYEDAAAYAKWAGKRLPSEAEWEFAARGGLEKKIYSWGDDLKPEGKWMANAWQGKFPERNSGEDGFKGAAPAKCFPPNGYGLYDMAGNVWELCNDLYDPDYYANCSPDNPQGPAQWVNRTTGIKGEGNVHHVMKGGSFLCHESYCMRYRPAAREAQDSESPTNHAGFRCVKD